MTKHVMVVALVEMMLTGTATLTITTFTFPLRKINQNRFRSLSSAFVVADRGGVSDGGGRISIDNYRPLRCMTSSFPHHKHNNNIAGRIDGVAVSLASMDNDQRLEEEDDDEVDDHDDNDGNNGEKVLREDEENGESVEGSDSSGVRNFLAATAPKTITVSGILTELRAIQHQGPQKYCILGTRHCSFLHQQIVELLSYALVLSQNHVFTSGAIGTNAAAIRGALRAERPDLLTVILPQSLSRQTLESQELLEEVNDLIVMPNNDDLPLEVASRICNSKLLSESDQLIAFAFHESQTVIEAANEARKLNILVTVLYLD